MDAASILALAVDEDSDQQEEEVGHAPVEGHGPGRPPRRLCRRVRKRLKLGAKQLQAQSLTHNNAGAATRSDSLLVVGNTAPRGGKRRAALGALVRSRRQGVGLPGARWKRWTPEAILKAVFDNVSSGSFSVKAPQKSAKSSAMLALYAVAGAIAEKQKHVVSDRLRMLRRTGAGRECFYITNTMHDETQLWLRQPKRKKKSQTKRTAKMRHRILAAAGQVSYGFQDGVKEDIDIFRQPTVLPEYTARQCASTLARPEDPTGLCPSSDVLPPAKYVGVLMASDSHAVNKLVSKFTTSQLEQPVPGNPNCLRCHIPAYCCQHKVGGCVEAVTKYLGVYSPAFCIATLLSFAEVASDLSGRVADLIEKELVVIDPVEAVAQGITAACPLAKFLMDTCYVRSRHRVPHDESGDAEASDKKYLEKGEQRLTPSSRFPRPVGAKCAACSRVPSWLLR